MMRWLMRRESIHRFASYLQWAIPGYLVELNLADEDADDSDAGSSGEEPDEEDDDNEVVLDSSFPAPAYTIAKKAPFSRSVAALEEDHGAPDFLYYLE
ncbi:hypothetical protein B0H10DRAFT_2133756, partial [Mycena sp. CBHHK59/15]